MYRHVTWRKWVLRVLPRTRNRILFHNLARASLPLPNIQGTPPSTFQERIAQRQSSLSFY